MSQQLDSLQPYSSIPQGSKGGIDLVLSQAHNTESSLIKSTSLVSLTMHSVHTEQGSSKEELKQDRGRQRAKDKDEAKVI